MNIVKISVLFKKPYKKLFLNMQIISLQVGLEPTTEWLTATRSTAELLKKKFSVYNNQLLFVLNLNEMES